ncbi:MAG: AEC family transporter [Colwellia sp.]|nr:AEC family transporter [Colwellia sp.]
MNMQVQHTLAIISPLILMALVGFICTKTKWFQRSELDAITKFTFYLSIPAFLFYQMANANLSQHVSPALFAAFYLPVLLNYTLGWFGNFLFHTKLKKQSSASAVYALSASYSNTIIVGLPILLAVFGDQVIGIVFLIVTFHSAMLFTLTSALSSHHHGFNWHSFIRQTFSNPVILSILSGLAFNLLSIELPQTIADSLLLVGKPAIPLALFILGASMTFYQVSSEKKFISFATILKLLFLPSLVYIAAHYIFALKPMVTTVLVILSACPTGVNAYLIAKSQGYHQETVAGTVVVTTLACIFTLPLWLWFLS